MKIILFLLIACLSAGLTHAEQRSTIGETAWIRIGGIPLSYLARIDTGAKTSSIHATNIEIINGSAVYSENIGKSITFQTINRDGIYQPLTAVITRISSVRNGQRTEQRYVIRLSLSWKNMKKTVEVNLRNRSMMNYKLLIGRNFLSKDFLVDVDMRADPSKQFHPKN